MREKLKKGFSRNWRLYVLMMPALLWLIVFAYMPMYGILIPLAKCVSWLT